MRKITLLALWLMFFGCGGTASGHAVVGEVTPLMERMKVVLLLLENRKAEEAMAEAAKVINDFPVPEKKTIEPGLKTRSENVDRTFGTELFKSLTRSIQDKNGEALKKNTQLLAFS